MASEFLENYEIAGPVLRKLYDSGLRMAILDALKDGPLRLADLRRKVGANAPNTSSKAKDLEKMGLLTREGGDFKLSDWGFTLLDALRQEIRIFTTYMKFKEYWDTHTIEGIPPEFRSRLGLFSTAELIKPKSDDIDWPDRNFINLVKSVKKRFWGVTSIFREEYLPPVLEIAGKGADVRIIISESLVPPLIKAMPKQVLPQLSELKNLRFFIIRERLLMGFDLGDDFCTLGLESKTGPSTHMDMNLVSHDPDCITLHEEMFHYFMKKAKALNFSDYV